MASSYIIINIRNPKYSELSRFYISILAIVISYFAISIAATVVGIMFQ